MLDLKAQLAQKEAEAARLKERIKKQDAAQKIVIGGLILSVARENTKTAQWLLNLIHHKIKRKEDLKRIQSLIAELTEIASKDV